MVHILKCLTHISKIPVFKWELIVCLKSKKFGEKEMHMFDCPYGNHVLFFLKQLFQLIAKMHQKLLLTDSFTWHTKWKTIQFCKCLTFAGLEI